MPIVEIPDNPPAPPAENSERVSVRIGKHAFNSAPSGIVWRNTTAIGNLTYTINRSGGFGEFSANVFGTGVEEGDTLFVFRGSAVLYAGQIVNIQYNENGEYSVSGSCEVLLHKNLPAFEPILPAQKAIDVLFYKIRDLYDSAYLTITQSVTGIATTTLVQGLAEGNVFDVISDLEGKLSQVIYWGISMDSATSLKYVLTFGILGASIHIPLSTAEFNFAAETTEIPSVIRFTSGSPKYPQVLPNSDFSVGGYTTESSFTELNRNTQDRNSAYNPYGIPMDALGGAEDGLNGSATFVLQNGASRKRNGGDNGSVVAFEEQCVYEVDAANEAIQYTSPASPPFKPKIGQQYYLSMYVKGEPNINTGNLPQFLIYIEWMNSGGTVLGTLSETKVCLGRYYHLVQTSATTVPVGTTKYRITITATGGTYSTNNGGVHIDKVRLRRKDEFYPEAWQIIPYGSSQVLDYSFMNAASDRKPYTKYCFCELESTITSGASNFVSIYCMTPLQVQGGRRYTWAVWLISKPSKTWPDFGVNIDFYNDRGEYISTHYSAITIVSPSSYSRTSFDFETPVGAAAASFSLRQTTSGAFVLGAVSIRAVEETATDYYGQDMIIWRNASTLLAQEPYLSLIANYGAREVNVSAEVPLVSDAETYLRAWLTSKLLFEESPRMSGKEIAGLTPQVTNTVYITDRQKTYPVEKITWTYGGDVFTFVAELQKREKSDAEVLLRIQDNSTKLLS